MSNNRMHQHPLTSEALETLVDGLPIGAIVIDDDGVIQRFNRHEEQLSGIPREKAIGRSFFSEIAPCTKDIALGEHFREGLAHGDLNLDFEFSFPYPHNRVPRDVRIRAVSVQTEPHGLHVVLIEDITSRRQLERNNEEMMSGLRSLIQNARSEVTDEAKQGPVGEVHETEVVALAATMRGFGDFASQIPPAELFKRVDQLMQRVVSLLDARGAKIQTIRGDGVTATFDVSNDNRRSWVDAVRAAHEVVELPRRSQDAPPFAIGLAAGTVVRGTLGRSEFGNAATVGVPVEIARALSAAARSNEVLLEDTVIYAVEDVVEHEHLRGVAIPGMARHGDVHRLVGLKLP